MSEAEVSALKETLCAQQELLQKLYDELEAEREASASAVSEALSVILRLEGEKAAVRMEAEQYKRLSEEKICHAEESISIFEDVIYQKEMEVAGLDHQVQAYRYKLLSMGCTDLDHDNMLQRNENMVEEMSVKSIGRRNSAPVCKKAINETDLVSRIVEENTRQEMCDQASGSEKKTGNSSPNSYWEQMRRLDDRVKEITGGNYMNSRRSASPLSARLSSDNLCADVSSSDSRNGVAVDTCCSSSIHDVFEVPHVDESLSSCESDEEQDDVHPQADKMDVRDETDWVKKVLQSTQSESKLYQRSDFTCSLAVPRISTSVYHQVDRTSEIMEEVERPSSDCCNREEEVKMLNDIKEKLDLLHDEIRCLKVKKSSTREDPCLSILSEVFMRNLFRSRSRSYDEASDKSVSCLISIFTQAMHSFWL